MFRLRGILVESGGTRRLATLSWNDGKVTGDFAALIALEDLLDSEADVCWTPTGPCVKASLGNTTAAYLACRSVFTTISSQTGTIPEPPEIEAVPPEAQA